MSHSDLFEEEDDDEGDGEEGESLSTVGLIFGMTAVMLLISVLSDMLVATLEVLSACAGCPSPCARVWVVSTMTQSTHGSSQDAVSSVYGGSVDWPRSPARSPARLRRDVRWILFPHTGCCEDLEPLPTLLGDHPASEHQQRTGARRFHHVRSEGSVEHCNLVPDSRASAHIASTHRPYFAPDPVQKRAMSDDNPCGRIGGGGMTGKAKGHSQCLTGQLDVVIGICVGSAVQIGLFLVPFTVLVAWPMDISMSFEIGQVSGLPTCDECVACGQGPTIP